MEHAVRMRWVIVSLLLGAVLCAPALSQEASASQLSLVATSDPPEGWARSCWGEVVFEVTNHGTTPARILKWNAHWEVDGEPVGTVSSDEDVIELPAGKTTEFKKTGWLGPDVADAAKPGDPTWCGAFTVEAADGVTELSFHIPIAEAVLREKTVLLKGKHVGIEIMESRVADFTAKDGVIRWLDECYEAMQDLTGYTPYGGEMIIIKETPRHPVWAFSGNPILMNTQYLGRLIDEMNEGIISFGWVHELGHDFDIPEGLYGDWYIWSGRVCEGMANFKLAYAYATIPSRDWRAQWLPDKEAAYQAPADGVLLDGKQFVDAMLLFEGDTYLPDHSRGHEVGNTPSFMLRLAYVYGWDLFKKWYRTYKRFTELGLEPPSDEEKISLMAAILSEAAGVDLVPQFQRWRYPVTTESVEAMKKRYPVKDVVASIVLE